MSTENENKEFGTYEKIAADMNTVLSKIANDVNFILACKSKGKVHEAIERLRALDENFQELAYVYGDISELVTGKFEYHYFTNSKEELENDGWDVD